MSKNCSKSCILYTSSTCYCIPQLYLYQARLLTIFHFSMLQIVTLYSTLYVFGFLQSFHVNAYKAKIFNLVDASWVSNSNFYFFIRILSEILIELSYDLWIIEKQLELISSGIQYTAIWWIWESLTCSNRYSFMLFIVCR